MLNCKQFTDLASDHIDQQHSGWKLIKIRMHLIICRHCRRFNRHLDRSRQTGAALAQQLWRTDKNTTEKIFSRLTQAPQNSDGNKPQDE
ncbi:Uncharacterised protein [Zhongshania aliphaticivorans]|uniref:Zinc-finger domain-containing protein n=1 Tax=Zhongshania aliphaticivorans TaxID=1470434 RepID=A0A5S9PZK2_9GAMM|nr:hypothetical protein [Zhongshania aliphaticivorans]CAA0109894.1 Uncharacterised protein [Zhongshania aliphaticivorans]CAA0117941.1 Uncharacterised protein [Zhongshania aliphaticivorans]CAA0121733.1 Uncharacterised protein [Zhongshania aliphaticivorans]